MTEVTRSSILNGMQEQLGIQQGVSSIPKQLNNLISPVFEVNPKFSLVVINKGNSSSGTSTIYTTPSGKDFYLTSITHSLVKDAASDNVTSKIQATIGGLTTTLLNIQSQTLTAFQNCVTISFPYPLKIDRNTNISQTGTWTVGTGTKDSTITGFILE